MSELQTQEQFEVLHRSTCKDLQLERADLEVYAAQKPVTPVIPELIATLERVLSLVAPKGPLDAETIFQGSIEAMGVVEAKRFVLDNLLEGLKRGEKQDVLLTRFKTLGLRGVDSNAVSPEVINSDADLAAEVIKGTGVLKRSALALAQIAANAMRTIPKFVEIEPSIHFLGPLPVLSFALKGKGMSIHQLFEALRAPGRFYGGEMPQPTHG